MLRFWGRALGLWGGRWGPGEGPGALGRALGSWGGRCQPKRFSQFSLMQFSSSFRIHFTFKDFRLSSDPQRLLDSVYQLTGNTHTASAILKVM